jgi:hypothetical protein
MPVFALHKTADNPIARAVNGPLTYAHGIDCYLGDLNCETNTKNITSLIVGGVTQFIKLLVLVTESAKGFWCVPFKVVVAREAPRVITSNANLLQYQLCRQFS